MHILWLDLCLGFSYAVDVHINYNLKSWPECHMDGITILIQPGDFSPLQFLGQLMVNSQTEKNPDCIETRIGIFFYIGLE